IAKGTIEAELRIANWGSQTPIDKAPPGTTEWQVIPFTATVPAPAAGVWWPLTDIGAPVADGNKGEIDATWVIDQATAALFVGPNPPRDLHQCIFVQLRD